MKFFFLDCFTRGANTLRSIDNTNPFPGITNSMLRKGKTIEVPESAIAQFYFDEKPNGIIPELFTLPTSIMSQNLFSALKDCGVDNIQAWPAKITDNKTGESIDYVLGNILNIVDIIDNEASEISPGSPTTTAILYKKIVFKKSLDNEFLIGRPSNKRTAIVVSESVRNHLEEIGEFKYISFHDPENYA